MLQIDLIPELMKLEEPIQRVATTLGTIPRIEDHPENPLSKDKLKPDKFRGHLVFKVAAVHCSSWWLQCTP